MICHICKSNASHIFVRKNGHAIYRCASCDLMYVYPIPASTGEIYEKDYFTGAKQGHGYVDYDNDKVPMIPVFQKYLKMIEVNLGSKGSLLDVGAATGFFVNLAQKAGFDAHGVEISDHAAAVGRSRGLDIVTGTLADVTGTYDCITILDVIEHVPDPRTEIERAYALLRSGGILVINTPDAGSLFARGMGKRWHLIVPPEHLFYFNRNNLRNVVEQSGLTVQWIGAIGKTFTLQYIFKTLYVWQRLFLWQWLSKVCGTRLLRRIAIPINLRDNLFMVAVKKR